MSSCECEGKKKTHTQSICVYVFVGEFHDVTQMNGERVEWERKTKANSTNQTKQVN